MSSKNEPILPLGNKPFWDQRRADEVKSVSERYEVSAMSNPGNELTSAQLCAPAITKAM